MTATVTETAGRPFEYKTEPIPVARAVRNTKLPDNPLVYDDQRKIDLPAVQGWADNNLTRVADRVKDSVKLRSQPEALSDRDLEEPPPSPSGILTELLGPECDPDRRRLLVVLAEAADFGLEQERSLSSYLRNFIEQLRDSNDPEDLVAVGAAIRKYVGLLRASDLGALVSLLEPGHRAVVPIEIEVELTKMVGRKLAANPPAAPDPEPALAAALYALAKAYLDPHVLSKGKHATVAINAIEALAGMLSPLAEEAIRNVNALPFIWLRAQLRATLEALLGQWRSHPLAEQREISIQTLERYVGQVQAV